MPRSNQKQVVHHSIGEYGRGDVYTNTAESSFALIKRGLMGVYCGEQKAFAVLFGRI